MHYRHSFHAGNFADVFKHVLLLGLLESLSRKDKPWCFFDTHAGAGHYRLDPGERAEWRSGIERLQPQAGAPAWCARYLDLVSSGVASRREYPGSPALALQLARDGDRVVCCERQADVCAELRSAVPGAEVHCRDGYEAHALTPPRERRGLVLIDPPFEARDEFTRIARLVASIHSRWNGACIAAWYPLKQDYPVQRFHRDVLRLPGIEALTCTLRTGAALQGQMAACGMLVLNPPWGWAEQAGESLDWLAHRLAQGRHAMAEVLPLTGTAV